MALKLQTLYSELKITFLYYKMQRKLLLSVFKLVFYMFNFSYCNQ